MYDYSKTILYPLESTRKGDNITIKARMDWGFKIHPPQQFIVTNQPGKLTLEQIDKRLSLFPEYLVYFIEVRLLQKQELEDFLYYLDEYGMMFINKQYIKLKSFDTWLIENKYGDLV